MKIGFFDSGIGGLTVLYEALKQIPNQDYIYYADTAHAPYGPKPKLEVQKYVFDAVEFLVNHGAEIIVVACNTATSIAVNELRKTYDIPIIGMEPAVKPAIEKSEESNKRVLVTATPLTLTEEKLKNLIERLDNEGITDLLALPNLVCYAEAFDFNFDTVLPYLKDQLKAFDINDYGTVVLGCTHFPLFEDAFKELFGSEIDIIDGSFGTVRHLKHILETQSQSDNGKGELVFYKSGEKVSDKEYAQFINVFNRLNKLNR